MIDLDKISDSPHLLDILLQMEDVLDSLDVYVFKNWYRGEVVEGPKVRRYWLDFTLKYDFDKMPDPKAALRLMKHGARVDFWKAKYGKEGEFEDSAVTETEMNDHENGEKPKESESFWLVRISIPRRLVAQMSAEEMDFYDDEVDIDDVEDAQDSGIDDESAYMDDEQGGADDMGGDPMGGPQEAPLEPGQEPQR